MWVVDAPLLDYVFQPIVNRSLRHPADVARSVSIGAAVNAILGTVLGTTLWWPNFNLLMIGLAAIAIQSVALVTCLRLFKFTRAVIRPGFANPLRVATMPARLGILVILGIVVAFMLMTVIRWDVTILLVLGHVLWISSFYFISCELPPAQPQMLRALNTTT
jgi:hypothetical protein